ncbi:MAG TPA: PIN domain-containing protein [Opitutaceae bacterium]|nr:PIN domain-containing protein [Opitutaceae bacterium]
MPRRAIIDANVVLRYLLNDDAKQSPEAGELIEKSPAGTLYLSVIVLAEVTWTLKSHFGVPRDEICSAIQRVLAQEAIAADAVTLDAVARYAHVNVDFIDCALAAAGVATGLTVATFDQDYRKFGDVAARRPRELLDELASPDEE